jgi:hypothetical protein
MRSARLAPLIAALFALLAVQPALGDTSVDEFGRTGPHHLIDTHRKPGVTCSFEPRTGGATFETYEGLLKRIEVRAPKMWATPEGAAFDGHQAVAWLFSVERQRAGGSWKETYVSPLQTSSATQTRSASFSPMRVKVILPRDARLDDYVDYSYRVYVGMLWGDGHGRWEGGSTHLVDWTSNAYAGWAGGTRTERAVTPCYGHVRYFGD